MSGYQLQPNEGIIIMSTGVNNGKDFADYNDELILTNMNIVYVDHGFFGQTKGIIAKPVSLIKVYDERAQVHLSDDGKIRIFFKDGQEACYRFTKGKKEAIKWVNEINKLVTGNPEKVIAEASKSKKGTNNILNNSLGAFGGAIESLKETFGSFSDDDYGQEGATVVTEKKKKFTTQKCIACGAPVSGMTGEQVKCEYCDTVQVIE